MSVVKPANSESLIENEKTMRYRPLGRTGLMVSALSFGCMRLGDDEKNNEALISRAIDLGINYFETTRHYIGGTCQHRTAPGLGDRRNDVIVSGKEGINPNKTAYQFLKEIERQLGILGLSHFKFYQVGWFSWNKMPHLLKPGGVLDAIREARSMGLIQHVGFTGHDKPENFIKCLETGLFDSITVPYNLINRSYEPTIQRAGEFGVGVVAMCPVAGGALSWEADRLKEALGMDMPTTDMALRFVLSNPNVSTVCSGMNAVEQLEQNVETTRQFEPTGEAFEGMCEGLDRLKEALGDAVCTACRYCVPCPNGVDIPGYMRIYRNWKAFGMDGWARNALGKVSDDSHQTNCDECGECERKCPNDLPILKILEELRGLS